jgi:beta-glucanase (GH16 family)
LWFDGTGSGDEITVDLKDNRAPDPGPAGWTLAWSDEFDDPAGTPPNPANWAYEIGDTTPDGKNGWGNEELQYYTDDPDNAATDGNGNLVITLDRADPSLECYYGPCQYESARLITQNKAEFAYGRIESRLAVATGGDGLWPAFWSLGTDITRNPWPGAGEIDVMEYVSRLPNEIFGTIHGPGYSGGGSFSDIYDFGERVDEEYHTFAVEWQPDLIKWFVDGIQYHEADPADVPGPWAFDKPFFLLLNFAIGGNFGGATDPANVYPQEYALDYVRVYQGPDTAERFQTTFTDSVAGWQQVSIPISDFVRSTHQPVGAPNDGLTLTDVWGYGFAVPEGTSSGELRVDLVRRTPFPPPTALTVTTLADSGPGSLREALSLIADDGTITFDPALAGGTITLTSGQLLVDSGVTIDASAVAPLTISAGGNSRVIEVGAGAVVDINDVVISDGVAAPQGGGILNRGVLSLLRVVVTNNVQSAAAPASFDLGGGGIYNAGLSTLNLTDSTVSDNSSPHQPGGGIYGYFNSTVNITRSTVSGNVSGDVAGGLRMLGNATIGNSTFSGNTSTTWHGGGIFHTDGNLTVTNSTFAENSAPAGTASGILVATFGAPASVTLTNNVIEGSGGAFACAIEGGGAATIVSGGGNVIGDGSCNPGGGDRPSTDALLGPLAANGGPTLTHALGGGSPAIDFAVGGACPVTDQRGVTRPRGGGCDTGAVEQS